MTRATETNSCKPNEDAKVDADADADADAEIEEKKKKKSEQQSYQFYLTDYHSELIEWQKNVDQRYAWVILAALWFAMVGCFGPLRVFGLVFVETTTTGIYTREEASWPIAMILTVENILGPMVPLLTNYISVKKCICLGGVLLVLGNILTTFSTCLLMDVALLGVVQGLGLALAVTPMMEIICNYFIRWRTTATGIAFSGASVSILVMSPLIEWILANYHWRYAYLATGSVCCIVIAISPLLTPNVKPVPKALKSQPQDCPSSTTVEAVEGEKQDEKATKLSCSAKEKTGATKMDLVREILKNPAFHVVWIHELVYFWVYGIFGIVLIDYGEDRGCTAEEADSLLSFQTIGEVIGRVLLAIPVDMQLISIKSALIIDLLAQASALTLITQVSGFYWLASITVALNSFMSFSYILLNSLIAAHIGEGQVTLAYSMASFISGLLIFFRPHAVGHFRDNLGTYDPLMMCLSVASLFVAFLWLIEPLLKKLTTKSRAEQGVDCVDKQDSAA